MFESINRTALILKPRQEFYDWLNGIFPDDPIHMSDLNKHDEATVYLLPDSDSTEESLEYLKANYTNLFEEILFGWCTDETLWPKQRNWKLFEAWIDFEIQSMVMDFAKGNIKKETY